MDYSVTRCYHLGYSINSCVTQVCVALTQNPYQGPRLLNTLDPTQDPEVSQVSLPCDSQGSIDFSSYPFQVSSLSLPCCSRCYLDVVPFPFIFL